LSSDALWPTIKMAMNQYIEQEVRPVWPGRHRIYVVWAAFSAKAFSQPG